MFYFARVILVYVGCAVSVSPAWADVAAYCAAYARDFADLTDRQSPRWQKRYDNAETDCMQRFATQAIKPVKPKAKPSRTAEKPKTEKPKVAAAPAPKLKQPEESKQEKAVKTVPKLVAGSPEWLAYCDKKYVSFDKAKGTYLSKSGLERKCLVTAD
jgi:BA14K-like protein